MSEQLKQAQEIVIEEYANVDETFQNIKNIKVGSMTLNDLFGDNLKVIENALEERKELLKWKNSQQDLIKGKDEYIAKLCNDRAELKEQNKSLNKLIERLTETDYYFVTSMALDMLKGNSNFALMYVDDIFCLVDTKNNSFEVIDNYDIDTENIGKSKCQELNDLREFAKLYIAEMVDVDCAKDCNTYDEYVSCYGRELKEAQFNLVKKMVAKYGKKED